MLVARLVGPSGEVVAVGAPTAVAKACARVTQAGFHNVSFKESNVDEILEEKPFDAAVGRFYSDVPFPIRLQPCAQFHEWCGREGCLFQEPCSGPSPCAFGVTPSLVRNGLSD